MAGSTLTTSQFDNSSDADFRAWSEFIFDSIIAGGWVQTADTGQIDFGTVLAPVAPSTSAGFVMLNSSDGGGDVNDFFVRIDFGSGPTSALRPQLAFGFGWETDGAGAFVTTTYPALPAGSIVCATNANPTGTSISINVGAQGGGAGDAFLTIAATNSTTESVIASFERTRNADLEFQDEIMYIGTVASILGNATNGLFATVNRTNYSYLFPPGQQFIIPQNAQSPIGGKAGLGLTFAQNPSLTSPSMNLFGVEETAIGVYQDSINVTILGDNHAYKIQRGVLFGGVASTVWLTRYE